LKELDPSHAEIKSMRVADDFRRRGIGELIVTHLLREAQASGYRRVSLETGSNPPFVAARALYARNGFTECEPFGDYHEDPWSVFMTLDMQNRPS
jgi:putative acetyltransferase